MRCNKTDIGPTPRPRLRLRPSVRGRTAVAAALALPLCAGAVRADEPGRTRHPFVVENASPAPIACRATIAHWFATDLGDAAPGRIVAFTVEIDADGTVLLANARGERMPVEIAYCGRPGHAWETRSQLDLRALAGRRPGRASAGTPVRIVCAGARRLTCR